VIRLNTHRPKDLIFGLFVALFRLPNEILYCVGTTTIYLLITLLNCNLPSIFYTKILSSLTFLSPSLRHCCYALTQFTRRNIYNSSNVNLHTWKTVRKKKPTLCSSISLLILGTAPYMLTLLLRFFVRLK
jgi:ATP/ADP translocase